MRKGERGSEDSGGKKRDSKKLKYPYRSTSRSKNGLFCISLFFFFSLSLLFLESSLLFVVVDDQHNH
jgi:hypothetical protein